MSDTRARVLAMLAESGIDDSEKLVSCLAELDVYLDDTPPEPSPELAALIADLSPNVVTAPFGRRRSRMFLAGVVAIGAVGAGGTAAAANVLPDSAQTIVAELSERFLPFGLPYPDGSRQPHTVTEETERLDPEDLARRAEEVATNGGGTATTVDTEAAMPSTTPSADATVAPSPSPSASATDEAAPPSEAPPADAEGQTKDADGESTAAQPSGSPAAEEPAEEGEPSAGGSTEPTTSPSASSDPSPTANTRTEVTDSPSTSPSPSTAPSGTTTSPTSSPSTAVWSDTD